jgi:predicted CopG family antitoxin
MDTNILIKQEYIDVTNKYFNNLLDTKAYSKKCSELINRLLKLKDKDFDLLGVMFLSESLVVYKSLDETAPQNHLKAIRQYLQEIK